MTEFIELGHRVTSALSAISAAWIFPLIYALMAYMVVYFVKEIWRK